MDVITGMTTGSLTATKALAPLRPIQKQTIGVAGYKNKSTRLYDRDHPHVTFITEEDDEPEPEEEVVEEIKRRVRTVDDGDAFDS